MLLSIYLSINVYKIYNKLFIYTISSVNAALIDQINTLWHTTNIYMHPKIHEYAEQLTAKMPGDLKVTQFCIHHIYMVYCLYT